MQLFAFVRDLVESGLDNAISIQGGPYLCNINCDAPSLTIELSVEPEQGDPIVPFMPDHGESRVVRCLYRFSLAFTGARTPIVDEDELWVERRASGSTANSNAFTIRREGDQYELDGPDVFGSFLLDLLKARTNEARRPALLIEHEVLRSMLPLNGLKLIQTYDMDSKGPKTAVLFGGKSELESDTHNLAIVLDKILSDEDDRRKFLNLLKDVLPFADELDTEPLSDSSLFFSMRERFSPGQCRHRSFPTAQSISSPSSRSSISNESDSSSSKSRNETCTPR